MPYEISKVGTKVDGKSLSHSVAWRGMLEVVNWTLVSLYRFSLQILWGLPWEGLMQLGLATATLSSQIPAESSFSNLSKLVITSFTTGLRFYCNNFQISKISL